MSDLANIPFYLLAAAGIALGASRPLAAFFFNRFHEGHVNIAPPRFAILAPATFALSLIIAMFWADVSHLGAIAVSFLGARVLQYTDNLPAKLMNNPSLTIIALAASALSAILFLIQGAPL